MEINLNTFVAAFKGTWTNSGGGELKFNDKLLFDDSPSMERRQEVGIKDKFVTLVSPQINAPPGGERVSDRRGGGMGGQRRMSRGAHQTYN